MNWDHALTPRMTRHALARCQEMGVPARLAKAIYRRASIARPSRSRDGRPATLMVSDDFPGYAVVIAPAYDGHPIVVTVVFQTYDQYDRNGTTYNPRKGN